MNRKRAISIVNGHNCPCVFPLEEVEEGIEDLTGFCVECGETRDSCEPDARAYKCDACGAMAVYGAEEIIVMGLIEP